MHSSNVEKSNNKLTARQLLKSICFVGLCLALVCVYSFLTLPRGNEPDSGVINPNAHSYLGEPENTLDLLVIGNSDARSGFAPMELWQSDGVTSHCVGIAKQNLFGAFSSLKDVMKTQQIKVLIVEVDMLFSSNNNKGLTPYEKFLTDILEENVPVIRYHDRWKAILTKGLPMDRLLNWENTYTSWEKGFLFTKEIEANDDREEQEQTKKRRRIRKFVWWRLNVLREYCEENGIEIVFTEFPTLTSWSDDRHDAVKAYTDKYGIDFIDLNERIDELGLNWSTDSADGGDHLNVYGARKVTAYLGRYVIDKYNLPDHRGDQRYAAWDEYLEIYNKKVED